VNADVKAQVTGYLLTRKYEEGSYVRKGELLFEIDPRPFQAALDQAKAQLAQAEAELTQDQAQRATAQANQQAEVIRRRTLDRFGGFRPSFDVGLYASMES
jgi:multidrug resistance efflux pump